MKRAQIITTVVLIGVALMLLGLAGRVAWLEKHVSADQIRKLSAQHTATLTVMPTRGPIYGPHGDVFATSVRMYNMFADPSFIADRTGKSLEKWKLQKELAALNPQDPAAEAIKARIKRCEQLTADGAEQAQLAKDILVEALSPLVERPADELKFDLEFNETYEDGVTPRRFLWLAREVDEAFHERFMKLKAELREKARIAAKSKDEDRAKALARALDGVGFVKSVKRVYPLGQLGGYIIGRANNYEGTDALEFALEHLLKGRPGRMQVIKDARRSTLEVDPERYVAPDDGRAVWVTIDPIIQSIAEDEVGKTCQEFGAESGCAIVMDPRTGKILAMASWPPFNPADSGGTIAGARNRCITDPYEPGSIFKPFVMAWALDRGLIKTTDIFNGGSGTWYDPTGRAVKDVHGCGVCTVPEVLIKSSNVCMAQIGWKMGIPELHAGITGFGFGSRTGIELPGDQRGLVTPLPRWTKGTMTSVSFGYEIAATPLQLVRAFGVFANDGRLPTPRVIGAVEDQPGRAAKWEDVAGSPTQKQVISAKTAQTMREIMEGVFSEKLHGTAKNKHSKLYRLFGKTGTAHLAVRGQGHYASDQYNSSFLVGGPMTKPQVVGLVTIHRPDKAKGHFGGTVAAPPAVRMMERTLVYLHVQPDQPEAVRAGGKF